MASNDLVLYVNVAYPKKVTFWMVIGVILAWLKQNSRYLLKYNWDIEIVDGEFRE